MWTKGLGRSLFSFSDDFAKQGPRKIGNEGGGGGGGGGIFI